MSDFNAENLLIIQDTGLAVKYAKNRQKLGIASCDAQCARSHVHASGGRLDVGMALAYK